MSGNRNLVSPQRWISPALAAALALALALATWASVAGAEENLDVAFPGARARAMGGAYTAIADDLSALHWNPAGMAGMSGSALQAGSRLTSGSGSLGGAVLELDTGVGVVPITGFSETPSSNYTYYLIAAATGFKWETARKYGLAGAIGYRRMMDMVYGQNQVLLFDQGGGTFIPWEYIDEGEGGVNAFTFNLAARPHSRFKVGLNLNLLDGQQRTVNEQAVTFTGITFFRDRMRTRYSIDGFSFELGVQAHLIAGLDVGAVLRPAYDVKFIDGQWNEDIFVLAGAPGLEPGLSYFAGTMIDQRLEVPTFYSVGAAYRPTADFLFTADYHHRPWDESRGHGTVDGVEIDLETNFYATNSVHFGGEYTVHFKNSDMPIRGGYHTTPTVRADVDSLSADISSTGLRTYRGARIEGDTISFGIGMHFATVHFDVGFDRTELTTRDFMLEQPPFTGAPIRMVELNETFNSIYFTSTLFY